MHQMKFSPLLCRKRAEAEVGRKCLLPEDQRATRKMRVQAAQFLLQENRQRVPAHRGNSTLPRTDKFRRRHTPRKSPQSHNQNSRYGLVPLRFSLRRRSTLPVLLGLRNRPAIGQHQVLDHLLRRPGSRSGGMYLAPLTAFTRQPRGEGVRHLLKCSVHSRHCKLSRQFSSRLYDAHRGCRHALPYQGRENRPGKTNVCQRLL